MGEVDQPHDAEDERQAGGVERVEPAQEHALKDGVDPDHHPHTPKYAAWMASWLSSAGRPVSVIRPSWKQ